MNCPKYTAQLSLNNDTGRHHNSHLSLAESNEHIIPAAAYWGDFRREHCVWPHYMRYSSILWGLRHGEDWIGLCYNTPAYIRSADGYEFREYAFSCDQGLHTFGYVWGIFYVPETYCGWEPPA